MVLTLAIAIGASFNYDFGYFCASLGCQLTSIFVYIFSIIALMCSHGLRHAVPMNYIVLSLFTASMGFMIAGWTFYLTPASVLMAVGVLAIILSALWFAVLGTKNMAKASFMVLMGILAACIL